MSTPLRALVGARVSVVQGPQKVSHIAQHKAGAKRAEENGWTVVGTFEDLDVSAAIDPWQRPDLGPWLSEERRWDWDVIIWSKIDRAFRSIQDSVQFAQWAKERKKIVVFAEDGLTLNYRDADNMSFEAMLAELFVYLGSFFGQLELNRFRTRALNSHSVLRITDRWPSGTPPMGFRTIPHPSGKGKGLATDSDERKLLHQMAGLLIAGNPEYLTGDDRQSEGWSYNAIAEWCNDNGYLTSSDRTRVANGKEPKNTQWEAHAVRHLFVSPATQGWKVSSQRGYAPPELILDEHGHPIRMAPPTFDEDIWEKIQLAVAERSHNGKRRTHSVNPLLGIGKCGKCGASLTQRFSLNSQGEPDYRHYRCSRTPKQCKGVSTPGDALDELFENSFLIAYRDVAIRERIFIPGTDNRQEIEQTRGVVESLSATLAIAKSISARTALTEQLTAADGRLAELEKDPYRPSRWDLRESEKTYGEVWASADMEQRRKLLQDAGAEVILHSRDHADIHLDFMAGRIEP